MWLLTTRGFYSATETFEDADVLQVRARDKQDLENLRVFVGKDMRILHTPNRDYEWRILIDKDEWADIVMQLTLDISYNNFKDEVTKVQGNKRHDIYLRVWTVLTDVGKAYAGGYAYGYDKFDSWRKPSAPAVWPTEADKPRPTMAELFRDENSIFDRENAEQDARDELVAFNGRTPVPAHWTSAKKKKTRRGKRGGRKRNRNASTDESGFDASRLPLSFLPED